jgi:hypothetical protein
LLRCLLQKEEEEKEKEKQKEEEKKKVRSITFVWNVSSAMCGTTRPFSLTYGLHDSPLYPCRRKRRRQKRTR